MEEDRGKGKGNMRNKILLIFSQLLFLIIILNKKISFSYYHYIIYFVLLLFVLFTCGLLKKDEQKKNASIYIAMYLILLFEFTFIIDRNRFNIITFKDLVYYVNLIPFKTINSIVISDINLFHKVYNLIGNLIAFMPLSFLLIVKDKKYTKIGNQIMILLPLVFFIEVIQLITMVGRFDVDDIILNVGGGIIFIFLLNKLKLSDRMRNLFYTDFNLSYKVKKTLYLVSCILLVLIDIFMFLIFIGSL